jgi:riboflavin synthase
MGKGLMFTGIITDIGVVEAVTEREGGRRFKMATAYDAAGIDIGASIACAGVCLTVVARGIHDRQNWFEVEAWEEALRLTTAAHWRVSTRLNLERALKVGDELGGHFVTGHVDGQAIVSRCAAEGAAKRFMIEAPEHLARFIAEKGSITLDGTSLTVNAVRGNQFDVLLIDHSLKVTTWGAVAEGDTVNIEVDPMARNVARYLDAMTRNV